MWCSLTHSDYPATNLTYVLFIYVCIQELKDETRAKKDKKKEDLLEKRKRQAENELKSSVYQEINASKMKSMSKKQLRMIKKTAMDSKTGKIKLVDAYDGSHGMKKILGKQR